MQLRSFAEVFKEDYLNKLAPNVNVIGKIVLKLDEENWEFTEDFSKLSLLVWQETVSFHYSPSTLNFFLFSYVISYL